MQFIFELPQSDRRLMDIQLLINDYISVVSLAQGCYFSITTPYGSVRTLTFKDRGYSYELSTALYRSRIVHFVQLIVFGMILTETFV